ncbi:MAG: hypothetical protein HY901_12310 [Deltaproteobacteria bacterium]|nr:hypothetical protein [Deltaproteobacteria bacterium]
MQTKALREWALLGSSQLRPDHQKLLASIDEALACPVSGEVIVRSGDESGRIFAAGRQIAWVSASRAKRTLGDHLAERGVARSDLRQVFEECRKSGTNFAEAIVEWGLLDRPTLREALLKHISTSFLEILRWPSLRLLVVPSTRVYRGTLTFALTEILAATAGHDPSKPSHSRSIENGTTGAATALPTITKEMQVNLDLQLKELKDIKGYKASGIMSFTGELLAADSVDGSIDLNLVGATFNDIFRSSHEVCEKIGMQACTEEMIHTPKGYVLMRCSGKNARAHVHLICILTDDGNQALARLNIDRITKKVTEVIA